MKKLNNKIRQPRGAKWKIRRGDTVFCNVKTGAFMVRKYSGKNWMKFGMILSLDECK